MMQNPKLPVGEIADRIDNYDATAVAVAGNRESHILFKYVTSQVVAPAVVQLIEQVFPCLSTNEDFFACLEVRDPEP